MDDEQIPGVTCEGHPTPEQMGEGAAITRTYFMNGVWFWLPVWETIGEPYRLPRRSLIPIPNRSHPAQMAQASLTKAANRRNFLGF
jgi:hypothetical protein